jgi:hypothetical protein
LDQTWQAKEVKEATANVVCLFAVHLQSNQAAIQRTQIGQFG